MKRAQFVHSCFCHSVYGLMITYRKNDIIHVTSAFYLCFLRTSLSTLIKELFGCEFIFSILLAAELFRVNFLYVKLDVLHHQSNYLVHKHEASHGGSIQQFSTSLYFWSRFRFGAIIVRRHYAKDSLWR